MLGQIEAYCTGNHINGSCLGWPITIRPTVRSGAVFPINGRMRDELLNESLFFGLDHARSAISEWIHDYNTARPHSSLNYRTPAAFAEVLTATGSYAALNGGFALPPVAQPAPNGVTETVETLTAAG